MRKAGSKETGIRIKDPGAGCQVSGGQKVQSKFEDEDEFKVVANSGRQTWETTNNQRPRRRGNRQPGRCFVETMFPLNPEHHLTPALSPTSWRRGRRLA